MKEEEFLSIIKTIIGDKYIGDDCAYLEDLGIVISQDSLVEDVHFSLKYMTPYQLGYKSAMVNISDISASGGRGKYITVALSLPKKTTKEFIKEFYTGLTDALKECGDLKVIGGDITGSDKVIVSITIIGTTEGRRISSRANAQSGHVIVTSGVHGSSAAGLKLLNKYKFINNERSEKNNFPFSIFHFPLKKIYSSSNKFADLINSHLMPKAQVEFGRTISTNIKEDYSMMDSSDGLADCLYKIAQASNKTLIIDFEKVQFDPKLKELKPNEYRNLVLFGGEDYQIIATVPQDFAEKYNLTIIGHVQDRINNIPVKIINFNGSEMIIDNLDNCYNHF